MGTTRTAHLGAALAALLATCLPTQAETIYALTADTHPALVKFDSSNPSFLQVIGQVNGLNGMTLRSIDFRPADGLLYGLATNGNSGAQLYTINLDNAIASSVGRGFTTPMLGDIVAMDFNPVVDRLRVVSSSLANFRVNPDTGSLSAVDAELSSQLRGVAYANNHAGATSTTLYAYDALGQLAALPAPNSGNVLPIGDTGVYTYVTAVGLDISASGNAYLALDDYTGSSNYNTEFYTLNLLTGQAQLVGEVPVQLRDIAVALAPVPEPGSMALWLAGIAGMGAVVRRRAPRG